MLYTPEEYTNLLYIDLSSIGPSEKKSIWNKIQNAFKNIVCKMLSILYWPQCVYISLSSIKGWHKVIHIEIYIYIFYHIQQIITQSQSDELQQTLKH